MLDYLEVIGRAQPLKDPPAPCIAVPTTAGTGAEVTHNSVLLSPEHRVKVSLRSPLMLPRVAVIDPELTFSLSRAITASTGLDALTQLVEPFTSARANAFVDALCRDAIPRPIAALPKAFAGDRAARAEMAYASLCGGLALANAGNFLLPPLEQELQPPAAGRLREVRAPTLVLIGSRDVRDIQGIVTQLAEVPGARLVTFDGVGHMLNLEAPEAFDHEVLAFLADVSR